MLKQSCPFCKIVGAFAILGALNTASVGLAQNNLVRTLFAPLHLVTVVYILIGLSAVALLASYVMVCPACKKK